MDITTKYSNGDKIWTIGQTSRTEWIECSFCVGKCRVNGFDGNTAPCPKCYGKGGENSYIGKEWEIMEPLTIGQVRMSITGESRGVAGKEHYSNLGPQKYSECEEYMCNETGIYTGSVYEVNKLYATIEEAQVECDKLNTALKEETDGVQENSNS